MTRITVRPDALRSTAARLSQAAREFDMLSQRTGSSLSSLDWEVQIRAQIQGDASSALTGLRRLSEQIDQLGRFLQKKAEAFDDADRQGVEGVGSVSSSWRQKLRDLSANLSGWFRGLVSQNANRVLVLGGLVGGAATNTLPVYKGFNWLRQEFSQHFAVASGGATQMASPGARVAQGAAKGAAKEITGGSGHVVTVGAPPQTETQLRQRLAALDKKYPGAKMEQWTALIWKVAQEKKVPPDLLAAIIMQESKGKVDAVANGNPNAGHGLMQIEFSAHKSVIQGATDSDKRAWLLVPENNVNFGADLLKRELDRRIPVYGEQEGTRRAVQYYNYGTGAADWVEKHSQSNDDWQATVQKASDTKLGKVDRGGSYGDARYSIRVLSYYEDMVAVGPPEQPVTVHTPDTLPVLIYDGSEPASGTTTLNAAHPVNPPLVNEPGQRDRAMYANVINQFGVGSNPRYTPRDIDKNGSQDTFCNIFVWDVTRAMGAEIPFHVSLEDGHSPVAVAKGNYMDANEMTRWLSEHGTKYGWREVSAEEAQSSANAGQPAVVAWDSHSSKAGHVAVVRPGEYSEKDGPVIAQAGRNNLNETTVSKTFANKTPRYFVHE